MSDDTDPSNPGIPVALIPVDMFADFYQIALWGKVDKDGETLTGFDYFAQLPGSPVVQGTMPNLDFWQQLNQSVVTAGHMGAFDWSEEDRLCLVIIANALEQPLRLSGDPYLAHGGESGHPDTETARTRGGFDHSNPDVIPGLTKLMGQDVCGVGLYRFSKTFVMGFGLHGTEGAIALETDDPAAPKKIAIAWCVDQSGNVSCAGTVDLSQYGELVDFYNATVAQNKTTFGEGLFGVALNLTIHPLVANGQSYPQYQVVTAAIQPASRIKH